jgi:hypothetical protein
MLEWLSNKASVDERLDSVLKDGLVLFTAAGNRLPARPYTEV